MSRHLRPTAPQPPQYAGYTLLTTAELARVVAVTDQPPLLQAAVVLYCRVLGRAQARRPCTLATLAGQEPANTEALAWAIDTLVQAQILAWVEEDEDGGAA